METQQTQERFEAWAVVELFGHQRIAGRLSEQIIGGCSFVRVDVPDQPARERRGYLAAEGAVPAYTKLFGQGAIYAISIVSEDIARRTAAALRIQPVIAYEVDSSRALAGPAGDEGFDPEA